jgi:uncharacterized membrane protein YccF (DUF307 family)
VATLWFGFGGIYSAVGFLADGFFATVFFFAVAMIYSFQVKEREKG